MVRDVPRGSTVVYLTADELLLLRQRIADPGGMAVNSALDAKLYQAQMRATHPPVLTSEPLRQFFGADGGCPIHYVQDSPSAVCGDEVGQSNDGPYALIAAPVCRRCVLVIRRAEMAVLEAEMGESDAPALA